MARKRFQNWLTTLCNEICNNVFSKTLDSLIENQSVKYNTNSSRQCLCLATDSELLIVPSSQLKIPAQFMNIKSLPFIRFRD